MIFPNPFFSIVICTRNRAGSLARSLQSILGQQFPKDQFEVIVVDDGSSDSTPDVVKSFQFSVHLSAFHYVSQDHQGLNTARNAGIQRARGEVVLFFDDDETAPPGYLIRMRNLFIAALNVDGAGGPLIDVKRSGFRTCTRCSLSDAYVKDGRKGIVTRLIGGNMAIRADAFKRVGLFDNELSGRGDESEWFHRARDLSFLFDPDLWVWHHRDSLNLFGLCRHSYVQGLSVPIWKMKTGTPYRPDPIRIARFFGHALLRLCAKGLVLAFREIGSVAAYFRLKVNR